MSFFPHTRLFSNETKTVDIAGSHIQVLDTKTGAILHTTTRLPESEQASLLKAGPIRCAAVDRELRYLLTSGEDKILKLWSLEDLKLVNERELPKKPTALAFTADAQTLLVSDKFGDVFSYPFIYTPLTNTPKPENEKEKEKDTLASHENPSNGQLILGHVSPLNAFLLSPDEKYILTADRDEHIRVSQYPRGYVIEMYCLGHLKFVSAIHIPPTSPTTLISGGGDPMLKIWDWMSGALKHEVPVLEVVEPFIVVKASRGRRWFEAAEGEAQGEAPEGQGQGKAKRGKRGKGRGKNKQQQGKQEEAVVLQEGELVKEGDGEAGEEPAATPTGAAVAETEEGVDPDTVMEDAPVDSADAVKTQNEQNEGEKVLVIRRIESVQSDDGDGTYVVFSAVGATAVFAFTPEESPSDIRHFDFGKPVLDFTVLGGRTILVNVDGQWTPSESESESGDKSMAKALKISNGQLVEDSETLQPLLTSLNSTSLIPSTPALLKSQNLYGDLISLPKYVDTTAADTGGDDDAEPQPIGAPVLSSSEVAKARGKGKGNAKGNLKAELTKKELGRIKTKQAVAAKALENQNQASGKRGVSASDGPGPEPDADGGEPDAKRARSEVQQDQDDGSMNTTT